MTSNPSPVVTVVKSKKPKKMSRDPEFQIRRGGRGGKSREKENPANQRVVLLLTESELSALEQYQIETQTRTKIGVLRRLLHKAIPDINEHTP